MYWLQGYAFKKRNFFRYFHYIFSFGILGTVIQFVTITLLAYYVSSMKALMIVRDDGVPIGLSLHECMLIASVFSAADEVATLSLIKQSEYPKLSAVLFGEGVMNDAISILLFHAVTNVNPPGAKEVRFAITTLHCVVVTYTYSFSSYFERMPCCTSADLESSTLLDYTAAASCSVKC
jgi:NhaP-type Na+/H+ or K+/H+ antiporter